MSEFRDFIERKLSEMGQPGRRYGKLRMLSRVSRCKFELLCDCGKKVVWTSSKVQQGTSCGCQKRINPMFARYKYGAAQRGLAFELTPAEVDTLTRQDCAYCGSPPSQKCGSRAVNGIDRIDNSLGYSSSNVVPSCKACNLMKRAVLKEDFLDHIRRIARHQLSLDSSFLESDISKPND